mmetsp:Transcript_578/g.1373  ORF Transcript_578/g.1373 Transcript_578/m.1373 type:complete len:90 (-) Transcript_578:1130-1399(-)
MRLPNGSTESECLVPDKKRNSAVVAQASIIEAKDSATPHPGDETDGNIEGRLLSVILSILVQTRATTQILLHSSCAIEANADDKDFDLA